MIKPRIIAGFVTAIFFAAGHLVTASAADNVAPVQTPAGSTASLTFSQVVDRAIQVNLASLLAKADTEEARGKALESASDLLPHIMGSASQSRIFKVNLEAQGFPANNSFFAPLIGPFNNFDARVRLAQTIFSWSDIKQARAGRLNLKAARLGEKLAEEQVASAAALAYMDALRTQANVNAAQADVDLAKSLFNLAKDRHKAGLSTGVDVARAETQFAQARLKLITSGLAARESQIRLLRLAGEPLGASFQFADNLNFSTADVPSSDAAVQQALTKRWEIQIANQRVEASHAAYASARSAWWPSLSGAADWGLSGNDPGNAEKTGSIGARLDLPLLTGGQIRGRAHEARALMMRAEAQNQDMRQQIEEDVRLSLETLTAEVQEVMTAGQAADLAKRELQMAQDRFSAGVGDNIQLVSAQTALSQAREDQVNALARYNMARLNFSMSLGEARSFKF